MPGNEDRFGKVEDLRRNYQSQTGKRVKMEAIPAFEEEYVLWLEHKIVGLGERIRLSDRLNGVKIGKLMHSLWGIQKDMEKESPIIGEYVLKKIEAIVDEVQSLDYNDVKKGLEG